MAYPIPTGNAVKATAELIAQLAEEAEGELHSILQSGSTDPVDYLMAIGRLLPILSSTKMEAEGIVSMCKQYAMWKRNQNIDDDE